MRHALGLLGVIAAGVLLAVSAAMNWRFGYSLGKSELDGQIYGAASAAADCLKALVPFFFFAAIRNKMWSQAAASVLVWGVVTAYSLTSALGHAALNRMDTSGHRAIEAQAYKDLRADLDRAKGQLAWIPEHRPASAVEAQVDGMKTKREWTLSVGCSDIKSRTQRDFCQQYHTLSSELASAQQAAALEARIADVSAKLAKAGQGTGAMTEADPQAKVLSELTGLSMEHIQVALTIFVALLLEIGSGLGMYIAFSQWRIHEADAPSAPVMASLSPVTVEPVAQLPAIAAPPRVSVANDNKSLVAPQPAPAKRVAPETDVQRFYKERIDSQDGSSLTAMQVYENYIEWCDEQQKEPLALPTFGREFGELGVFKAKSGGRVRYNNIALRSGTELVEDKKLTALGSQAA